MKAEAKQEILDLIAADEIEAAIEKLLLVIPTDKSGEVILQSSRLEALQKDIRLGLISQDNSRVTKNQIVFGILETLKAIEGTNKVAVLVAGSSNYQLANQVYFPTKSLGKAIGTAGFSLVCGGWEGVDYVVADEFSKVSLAKKIPLSKNLVQVVIERTEPVFKGGNIVYVKQGLREWIEAIKYADVVVLIGGLGGTYEMFVQAHQEARPVIPIGSSGGDAKIVFHKIMEQWNYWNNNLLKGISKTEFELLNQPIETQADADFLVQLVIKMIDKLVKH